MAERKRLLLRLDPDVYERVARWAADDLRSVNAQIEYALRRALRFLDVDDGSGGKARLFTARVDRVRATYTFNARSFVRVIGQWVETKRDPSLYEDEVEPLERSFSGSVLFAYKLNWQTVLFVGYGDERAIDAEDALQPTDRSLFVKVSYAFQR